MSWFTDQGIDVTDPNVRSLDTTAVAPAGTGAGIPWNPGASQPSSSPEGYTWSVDQARFIPTTGTDATSSGPMDDAAILAQISKWAAMPGADPSLANDPQYWLGRIKQTGGLRADNLQYWQDASVGDKAFFRNPNRESGSMGSLGSLGQGFGGLVAPFTGQFAAPTAEQAEAMPGYQFARDQGLQAIARSNFAKGTGLTGGAAKDAAQFASGLASTNYGNLFNQSLATFGTNRDTFYHNQDSPYQKYYGLASLGRPTTP